MPPPQTGFKSAFARSVASTEWRDPKPHLALLPRDSPSSKEEWCGRGWRESSSSEESKEEELAASKCIRSCVGSENMAREVAGLQTDDSALLHDHIHTLQWQLKQAESNRQMYRAVMEQVSKFLERVHKALETSATCKSTLSRNKHRGGVCRSRSVQRGGGLQEESGPPSPPVHRTNSLSHIHQSPGHPPAQLQWCGEERLGHEAFRLLRTVRSFLATDTGSDLAFPLPETKTPQKENWAWRAEETGGQLSGEEESGFSSMSSVQGEGEARPRPPPEGEARRPAAHHPPPPHPSPRPRRSASFQAERSKPGVGLVAQGSFHQLGLPLVDLAHRRWSSTPHPDTGRLDPLTVLWV